MLRNRCVCGCGRRGQQRHHVVYRQELRHASRRPGGRSYTSLVDDERNKVWVTVSCHDGHHDRSRPFRLMDLPDSVFEFAREVLGAGPAYEYLRRRYAGQDQRLDALVA